MIGLVREVTESRIRGDGVELALFDWPASGPTVFFAGEAIYDPIADVRIMRGHPGHAPKWLSVPGNGLPHASTAWANRRRC